MHKKCTVVCLEHTQDFFFYKYIFIDGGYIIHANEIERKQIIIPHAINEV